MFTTSDGLKLYYEIHGNADSQSAIVFLNGLTQSTIAWSGVLPYLGNDHRIILLDLIFQGKSEKATAFRTFDEHAKDVKELLQHLQVNKACVCGISYGGAVAQHFAVNYPESVSGLILLATFAHKTAHFNVLGDSWVSALKAGGYPLMLDVMLPVVLGEDYFEAPLIPIETMKQMRIGNALQTEDILDLIKATEERKDYREDLRRINAPTLIIHGEKDILITVKMAEEIQKNIKGSRLQVIEKAGHTLNLEAIPVIGKLIREFLGGLSQ